MNQKSKAAFPQVPAFTGKTASIKQLQNNSIFHYRQTLSQARRLTKSIILSLACWELLPAALTVLLLGGFPHE